MGVASALCHHLGVTTEEPKLRLEEKQDLWMVVITLEILRALGFGIGGMNRETVIGGSQSSRYWIALFFFPFHLTRCKIKTCLEN